MKQPKYVVLEKQVGETPLQVILRFKSKNPELENIPMAYAGRLDPMASGKLIILIGEECKKQTEYHAFDKGYQFEILLNTSSDTGDILGLVDWQTNKIVDTDKLIKLSHDLVGRLSLPYPNFSSKTVKGKPLHVWTLENKLNEIEIPVAHTNIYKLELVDVRLEKAEDVYKNVVKKITSLPTVTDESKKLGRDFRRKDVLMSWQIWLENHKGKNVQIATFNCVASSGTYMRSLAEELSRRLGTVGLAYSIHRFMIGKYLVLPWKRGFWWRRIS